MRPERCRVVVKCRPTCEDEEEGLDENLKVSSDGKIAFNPQGKEREAKEFAADHVYLPQQGDAVYNDEVRQLVSSLYQGFNATVFAYGASGSGKTYTVLGSRQASGKQHSPGLIDRVIDDVFARFDERSCTVKVSMEELYKEQFTDLLAPMDPAASKPPPSVHFRTPHKRQQPSGSKYKWQTKEVNSGKELRELVHHTLRKRHTAQTILNKKSSRSHVIVTLSLEQRIPVFSEKHTAGALGSGSSSSSSPAGSTMGSSMASAEYGQDAAAAGGPTVMDSPRGSGSAGDCSSSDAGSFAGVTTYLLGKLYLVDLAGSENIKRSGAEGQQQKEAGMINQSLCHLKTVIEDLFKGERPPTYRNSKLTLKLKDALGGGNSKLLIVACISTALKDLAETKETLRFAEMARSITNTPTINREPKDELIERLRLEIEELHDQLNLAARGANPEKMLQQQLNALEAAYAELQEELESKEARWAEEAAESKQHSDNLQQQLAGIARELCATNAREAALQRQQAADESTMQQLQRQLQATDAAQTESLSLMEAARSELLLLGSHCSELQRQMAAQQAAADTARHLCSDQQKQTRQLQQQLEGQAVELDAWKQQLRHEEQARATAEQAGEKLQQQLDQQTAAKAAADLSVSQLREQLQHEAAARAAAEQLSASLAEHLDAKKAARSAAEQNGRNLGQQLQQEVTAAAAAQQVLLQQLAASEQQTVELQQQLQAQLHARRVAESTLSAIMVSLEPVLQELVLLQRQLHTQQARQANASSSCTCCVTNAKSMQQQLSAETSRSQQLQQALQRQQEEQQIEQQAAAAERQAAAAQLGAQLQHERDNWQQAFDALKAEATQLQQQAADDRAAHAAEVAGLKQQYAEQLSNALQSSVQKAVADKLRCKEHLYLHLNNLMADAASLSEALDQTVVTNLPETPASTRLAFPGPPLFEDAQPLEQQLQQEGSAAVEQDEHRTNSSSSSSNEEQQQEGQAGVGEGDAGQLGSEGGEELSFAGSDAGSSRAGSGGDAGQCDDVSAADLNSAFSGSSCSLASACLGQTNEQQQVQAEQQQAAKSRHGSSSSQQVVLPALNPVNVLGACDSGASADAARWPIEYPPEPLDPDNLAEAAKIFRSVLGGGKLTVEKLEKFLKKRTLGGVLHRMTLPGDGDRKRKHHLVQDMLAWYDHHTSEAGLEERVWAEKGKISLQ